MCKTRERQHRYDIAYMKMAQAMAELSYAIKKQVGAIIVSAEDQVISQGFNGTPEGFDNCCETVLDDNRLVTNIEVLHAETNAISKTAKYSSSTKGATLYVTLSPCIDCAKLIVQSEIARVVYLETYKDLSGIRLLEKCGIKVEKLIMSIIETDKDCWFTNDDGSKWIFCSSDNFEPFFYAFNTDKTLTYNMFHKCTSEEYNKKYRKNKNYSDKQ